MKKIAKLLALILCTVFALTGFAAAEDTVNYSVYADQCIATLKSMASFMMGANNQYEIRSQLMPGSEAKRLMDEYARWGRTTVGSQRFADMKCTDFTALGDNRFSCHITGTHYCSYRVFDDCVFKLEYTMYFQIVNRTLQLYNFEVGPGADEQLETPDDGLRLTKIYRKAFRGYVLEVSDPSRVFVGVTSQYFSMPGKQVSWFCNQYGAVAGINANGFDDPNGRGDGSKPLGLVVSDGKILRGAYYGYGAAGFDANNKLHAGYFFNEDVTRLGLRDAVSFKPVLICDGKAEDMNKVEKTGLNGRTALGQKADGTVLMVVLEGGQSDSPGAEITDVIAVMQEFGAVNACNLDGGPSSVMYFNNRRLSGNGVVTAFRDVPCAVLVKPK